MNTNPALIFDVDAARAQLDHLFGDLPEQYQFGKLELAWSTIKDGRHRLNRGELFSLSDIDALIAKAIEVNTAGSNVYFGGWLRKPDTFPGARASDEDAWCVTSVYADFDQPGTAKKGAVTWKAYPPSLAVLTGKQPDHRIQSFWKLSSPSEDKPRISALIKEMATTFLADPTISNSGRVLRLAGSIAHPAKPGRVTEATKIITLKNHSITTPLDVIETAYAEPNLRQTDGFEADLGGAVRIKVEMPGINPTPINSPQNKSSASSARSPANGERRIHRSLGGIGRIDDGRELYMTKLVWAAVVNWYRESPMPPTEAESQQRMREVWATYERKNKTRLPGDNVAGLEKEGRGQSLFAEKWHRAIGKWNNEVEEEAAKSPLENEASAPSILSQMPTDEVAKSLGLAEIKAREIASQTKVEPVDLWARFDPPSLPRGLLPQVIDEYAFVQGETMGADPGGIAMAALAVCAGATPDSIELQMKVHSKEWCEQARIWVALIGPPSAKKSPIISAASRRLKKLDAQLLIDYQSALARYKELSADESKGVSPPQQKRLRLEDTTIEGAQEVLAGSTDGVLLLRDELSGWFGGMDKYSGGGKAASMDRSFWLQSYNGGQYALNRITRGVALIPNLSVCLLGGIQPDLIRKVAADSVDDGLMQRLLPINLQTASIGLDVPVPPVIAAYETLVERLTKLSPPRNVIDRTENSLRFDLKAQAIRDELEAKHLALMQLETVNRKLASHIGKCDGLFGRLCVLWHCIEHAHETALPPRVSEQTARRVSEFMQRFLLPHSLAFYAGVLNLADDHDRLTAVAGYILAHKLGRVTNRDIARGDGTMRKLTARDTEAMFEQLEALGWVLRTQGPKTIHWVVNPEVHIQFAARAEKEAVRRAATRKIISELSRKPLS